MFFACRGFAKYASSWPSFRCQHGFFFTKNEPKSNRKSTPRALCAKLVFYHPNKLILDRFGLPFWVQKSTQNPLCLRPFAFFLFFLRLWCSLDRFWWHFGPSWRHFGSSWVLPGASWCLLAPTDLVPRHFWLILGAPWCLLVPPCTHWLGPRALFAPLRASKFPLFAFLFFNLFFTSIFYIDSSIFPLPPSLCRLPS